MGLAWDPNGDGKQSIRASWGIFFDTPESYTMRDFGASSPWGNTVSLIAPVGGFANPYAGFPGGNLFPTPYPPTKSTPFSQSAQYIMAPPKAGAFYANITSIDDGLNANYNALRVNLEHRFSNHFTALGVYTWSHCLQNAEPFGNRNNIGSSNYQNPYNRNADYGRCDSDVRHSLNTSFVIDGPRFANKALDWIAGNWQLGFLVSVHTGFPFNVVTGVDNSLTGVGQDRPNVVGAPYVKNNATQVWLNPLAFVPNPLGTFGNTGYNAVLGPGFFDLDTNLKRIVRITEKHKVELRFEFFNVLNHTNFSNPVNSLKSTAFGVIQSSADPRILQLAAKYSF